MALAINYYRNPQHAPPTPPPPPPPPPLPSPKFCINLPGVTAYAKEYLETWTYSEFQGETECIMGKRRSKYPVNQGQETVQSRNSNPNPGILASNWKDSLARA